MVVVVDNDSQAVLRGLAQGQLAFQGLNPSGGVPRGAPPMVDPAQKQFSDAIAALNALATVLQRSSRMDIATDIGEYANKVQRAMVDAQKELAKKAVEQAGTGGGMDNSYRQPFPNVNAGGTM